MSTLLSSPVSLFRHFFTLLCLVVALAKTGIFHPSPIYALDPVIINRSDFAYPQSFDNDQDYRANIPGNDPLVEHQKTYSISNSFSPECVGSSGESCTSYSYRNIDQIQQELRTSNWNNPFNRRTSYQWTSLINQNTLSSQERRTALRNYRVNTPNPSYNSTVRVLSTRDRLCLLSRKAEEVTKFIEGTSSTVMDDEIVDNIRFSRAYLAFAMSNPSQLLQKVGYSAVFFENCESATQPRGLPDRIRNALARGTGNEPSDAIEFYFTHLQPGARSSYAMNVQACDTDMNNNNRLICKDPVQVSMPMGSAIVSTSDVMSFTLPQRNTKAVTQDYGNSQKDSPTQDHPNPFSNLFTAFNEFWNGILDTNQTFNGPVTVKYFIPQNTEKSLDTNLSSTYSFLPIRDVNSLKNSTPSTEDDSSGLGLQPGSSNSKANQYLFNSLKSCRDNPTCMARL